MSQGGCGRACSFATLASISSFRR